MFEYIKGAVASLKPSHIILEANSVGYFVNISLNTYTQLHGQESIKLYIHQVIREDAHPLYGFATESERELFRMLISVSGIGSNTAIMMFSSQSPEEIRNAILNENVTLLKPTGRRHQVLKHPVRPGAHQALHHIHVQHQLTAPDGHGVTRPVERDDSRGDSSPGA